jgi:hypothetical protein
MEIELQVIQSRYGWDIMQIADLFDQVISNSEYAGNFEFDKLLEHMHTTLQSGLGIEENGSKNFILIFVKGEPEGAALIEDSGMLFGDKAIYLLKQNEIFKLFLVESEFAESLAARCKVYDKSHLKKILSKDLPTLGGNFQSLGKLCVVVKKENILQSGMRVSLRKGRQVLASDITAGDGRACFKVMNGAYDCVILDREQKSYKFRVEFNDAFSESEINLGV